MTSFLQRIADIQRRLYRVVLLPTLIVFLVTACDNDDIDRISPEASSSTATAAVEAAAEAAIQFRAEVRRTEYGIPHIQAEDWMGLGYGFGYAYAQDNYCVTMREIVFASGRSAELLGSEGNIESDFLFRFLNGDKAEFQQDFVDPLPQFARELAEGYTAGMNRYLRDTGVENLPEGDFGCRDADWVFEFDTTDLFLFLRREALRGSSDNGLFRSALLSVQGPDPEPANKRKPSQAELEQASTALRQAAMTWRNSQQGSNALAVGSTSTQNGSGMLLGNPHQPWFGAGAWYMAHLTIPGVYDVAGAALHGFPFIGIGFNKDLAWTHTVSLANRFSFYELKLNPDNPLQYEYDGEFRDIETQEVSVQILLDDGSMETQTRTFYTSHYGPIANLGGLNPFLAGWPMFNGSIMAFRDANILTGVRGIEQWITKGQASSISEYRAALANIGNPVFHEIAADRNGTAFYGEISAIPFISQQQLQDCVEPPIGTLLASATTNVIVALNGADSACEWGDDPEAPAGSNLYGAGQLPQLETTDYVGNSNNSYWLSNVDMPLEGFPTIMGPVGYEGLQQFARTRIGHQMVAERKNASDDLSATPMFDLETIKGLMYANRVYSAELVLDDVMSICAMPEATSVQAACQVLGNWDRRVNLDSRGAQVWHEFWDAIQGELSNGFQGVVQSDQFWRVDYDPANPIATPSGIDTGLAANITRVVNALETSLQAMADNNVALDAPWGDVQYLERNGENIGIHGGQGSHGIYGAISAGLSEGGYINPGSGNSYIQAVTWDESDCPIADAVLVPSQSTDPASPHFADQTRLYSNKEWLRFPYCDADITAAQIGETLEISE